jgi:carboxypeptidase family protein
VNIISFLFVTCCVVPGTLGSQANTPSAKVEGTVFVRDSAGNQSFVSGATVRLNGPATLEAETDATGKYVVPAVPFGIYTVEVALPGLRALRTVKTGADHRLDLYTRSDSPNRTQVHRSISASDHYPLSITLAFT